jgi:predicted nucleic acid-binding Zn ribbon protein
MASKKPKSKKQIKPVESQDKKRARTLQIIFMAFSVILILSMMLSLASK